MQQDVAVSGPFFVVCVLIVRALVFGIYIRGPDFVARVQIEVMYLVQNSACKAKDEASQLLVMLGGWDLGQNVYSGF